MSKLVEPPRFERVKKKIIICTCSFIPATEVITHNITILYIDTFYIPIFTIHTEVASTTESNTSLHTV